MKRTEKSVFFFIRPRDLAKVCRLCDILWSEYGVNTRVDMTKLPAGTETIKSFVEDFKIRNGQTRIFVVNDADRSCEAVLKGCIDLPIHTLSLNESDIYEQAKMVVDSFDFSERFVVG